MLKNLCFFNADLKLPYQPIPFNLPQFHQRQRIFNIFKTTAIMSSQRCELYIFKGATKLYFTNYSRGHYFAQYGFM